MARLLVRCFAASLLLAVCVSAEIHSAKDPAAYTEHQYRKDLLKMYQRDIVDAYRKLGSHNRSWDAPAEKFLNGMALRFASSDAEALYALPNVPSADDLLAQGGLLLTGGCDDPMVIYCQASLMEETGQFNESTPLLRKAVEGLGARQYPAPRIFAAAARLMRHLGKQDAQEYKRLSEISFGVALDMASAADHPGKLKSALFHQIWTHFDRYGTTYAQNFYDVARKHRPDADQWFVNTFGGHYHVKAAWEARGSGWASTVTEEGWKGFKDHLHAARECLVAAYKLDPTLPEAPAEMITVCMGGDLAVGENERVWFDRTCDAQFDYGPAYSRLFNAMLPRWGGSHEDMYALGTEAFQTGRFDTRVPTMRLQALQSISADYSYDLSATIKEFDALADLNALFDAQRKANADRPSFVRWVASYQSGLNFAQGDQVAGFKYLEAVNGEPDPSAFAQFGVLLSEIQQMRPVMNSAQKDQILLAEKMRQRGRISSALKEMEDARNKLAADAPEMRYVDARIKIMQVQRDVAAGKTIELMPTSPDLVGWYPIAGKWTLKEDGTLEGISDETGCQIVFGGDFGERVEFSGSVEVVGRDGDDQGGPIVCYSNPYRHQELRFIPADKEVRVSDGRNGGYNYPAEVRDRNDFVVSTFVGMYWALVNGKPVLEGERLFSMTPPQGYVGLVGTISHRPGKIVRFKDLRVRKLPRPPQREIAPELPQEAPRAPAIPPGAL